METLTWPHTIAAYRLGWRNLPYLLRLAAPWAILVLACLGAGFAIFPSGDAKTPYAAAIAGLLRWTMAIVAASLMDAALLVAACRAILTRERLAGVAAPLGRRAWRVLVRKLVLDAIGLFGITLGGTAAFMAGLSHPLFGGAAALTALVLVVWIRARLAPYVVAPAVDDEDLGLAATWRSTRGWAWRITVLFLAVVGPWALAEQLVQTSVSSRINTGRTFLDGLLVGAIYWVILVGYCSFISAVLTFIYLLLRKQLSASPEVL
jgi:hypothetical protein